MWRKLISYSHSLFQCPKHALKKFGFMVNFCDYLRFGYVKMTWELLNLQNAISSYIYKINLFSNNEMDDFGMIFSFAFSKKEIKK